ncbi:MAG: hypothetical protein IJT87_10675 [Ruminiclostridium sp.]|nr:hypothetical protein [Ruminiclostridium sp.]
MNRKVRKSLCAALAGAILLTSSVGTSLTACADSTSASVSQTKKYNFAHKIMKTYILKSAPEFTADLPVYFFDSGTIPYYKLEDFAGLYRTAMLMSGLTDFDFEMTTDGEKVRFQKKDGFYAEFDFENDTIYFFDYNGFLSPENRTIMDIVVPDWKAADGTYSYIKTLSTATVRYGHEITMDLGAYNIKLRHRGDGFYVPLQTMSDIFLAPNQLNLLYNGRAVILYNEGVEPLVTDGGYTALGKIYYGKNGKYAGKKIGKDLAEYSYNELCFAMDHLYGLKANHNIDSFAELVDQRGFAMLMTDTDTRSSDYALYQLIHQNLDDQHSIFKATSYASGYGFGDALYEKFGEGRARDETFALKDEYKSIRDKYNPDGVPGYQEVGDTAYITFDGFYANTRDYYEKAPTADDKDTFGIIAYSVQQILRKDSPIKNVVLDLSCNTGGQVDAAVYTIAAFLGKASISLEDPNTGALVTNDYKIDTNFDHKFNSKDTLAGKGLNLYCLESKVSFSCGNLVPSMFKDDPHVTLIGQRSGGGACSVMPMSTATGTLFRVSSSIRLSFLRNGSFYDIDQGAEPDFVISKAEHFYDREELTKYIDGLF